MFQRAASRAPGSPGMRPRRRPSASSAPRSRCLRYSEINDEYSPSRRSSAPLPALSSRSYSASTPQLVRRGVPPRPPRPRRDLRIWYIAHATSVDNPNGSGVNLHHMVSLPRPQDSGITSEILPHAILTERGQRACAGRLTGTSPDDNVCERFHSTAAHHRQRRRAPCRSTDAVRRNRARRGRRPLLRA